MAVLGTIDLREAEALAAVPGLDRGVVGARPARAGHQGTVHRGWKDDDMRGALAYKGSGVSINAAYSPSTRCAHHAGRARAERIARQARDRRNGGRVRRTSTTGWRPRHAGNCSRMASSRSLQPECRSWRQPRVRRARSTMLSPMPPAMLRPRRRFQQVRGQREAVRLYAAVDPVDRGSAEVPAPGLLYDSRAAL